MTFTTDFPQARDERMLLFCKSDAEKRYVEAFWVGGSTRQAGRDLDVNQATVSQALKRVMARAAMAGYAPGSDLNHEIPQGFTIKGVSDMRRNSDGLPQWIKYNADAEEQERLLREAIDAFKDELPRVKPTKAPKVAANDDLANCYILTDYHLGMLAWPEETGGEWNTKLAEELLIKWFGAAIAQSPPATVGVLSQLGDFLHWDGKIPETPISKHTLDADTRFPLLVRVAIRALRAVIGMMLKKYPQVHIVIADANHDPASAIWMREWLAAHYENEPRVKVDTSPDTFYCFEWGKTSVFFHHGHRVKPKVVDATFAAKFRKVFGRTEHSYAHTGHLHHFEGKETALMKVEQHPTLAAKDAHAASHGWMAARSASVITYHKEFGDVGRVTLTPEMVA